MNGFRNGRITMSFKAWMLNSVAYTVIPPRDWTGRKFRVWNDIEANLPLVPVIT